MRRGDIDFFMDLFDPERAHRAEARIWYDAHADRPLFAPSVVKWVPRSSRRSREWRIHEGLQRFTADVETIRLTDDRALAAARVEQEIREDGEPLAIADCSITGIVRAVGGTVVTGDRDFERVRGLTTEFDPVSV